MLILTYKRFYNFSSMLIKQINIKIRDIQKFISKI